MQLFAMDIYPFVLRPVVPLWAGDWAAVPQLSVGGLGIHDNSIASTFNCQDIMRRRYV